jgi:hypothetical protein
MNIFIKLIFSLIVVAIPAIFWWSEYRYTQSKSLRAIVKRVEILRLYINPAWQVTIAYEVESNAYLCDVNLSGWDWPGGVTENQEVMIRVNKNSPKKCFIETSSTKPVSGFIRYFSFGFSACALILVWTS